MGQLAEKPIFVVGHPRSGTTLLRFLLSSHPRIYIPEETGFIPFLVPENQIEADLNLAQVEGVLARMGKLNHLWRDMVGDVPAFYESLPEPKLAFVLDTLYQQQMAGFGARRWGDKTPLYIRHMPLLDRLFPTAQFVHLIRDGRDAALSALEKWPERRWYMDAYYLLEGWRGNVEAGRQAGRALGPSRYLEVRYEDLVRRPRQVLERVCTFLDEEFVPEMLDHTGLARQVGPGPQDHTEVQQPISPASVRRWQTGMDAFDQKMADRLAGPLLSELDYELAGLEPFSAGEWARLLLLAGRFRLFSTTRHMLYGLGILTLNRGMRR
jgi:hypothetical protein